MTIRREDNTLQDLISTAQNFTASWVDLGESIDVRDIATIGLYLNIDINDSLNTRVRMVAVDGSDEYELPILTVGTSSIAVDQEYFEFTDDADQLMILSFNVLDLVGTVKFQIQAGTAGATPGQIDGAKVSYKTIES